MGLGWNEPLLWYEGSAVSSATRRYLHADHQGSIVAASLPSGAMQQVRAYDAYGQTDPNNALRFQYTGQAAIPEVGLLYYKARFYSPALGRFMQTDPIGYEDDNNLYAFVYNDPLNKTDPEGEIAQAIIPIIAVAITVTAAACAEYCDDIANAVQDLFEDVVERIPSSMESREHTKNTRQSTAYPASLAQECPGVGAPPTESW